MANYKLHFGQAPPPPMAEFSFGQAPPKGPPGAPPPLTAKLRFGQAQPPRGPPPLKAMSYGPLPPLSSVTYGAPPLPTSDTQETPPAVTAPPTHKFGLGVRILCSKIRKLCSALMLALHPHYAPQNRSLCPLYPIKHM